VKEAGSNSEKDDLLILQRFLTKMFGRKKCARQQAVLDSLSSYPFSLSLSLSSCTEVMQETDAFCLQQRCTTCSCQQSQNPGNSLSAFYLGMRNKSRFLVTEFRALIFDLFWRLAG
jgi:hypothetical protein